MNLVASTSSRSVNSRQMVSSRRLMIGSCRPSSKKRNNSLGLLKPAKTSVRLKSYAGLSRNKIARKKSSGASRCMPRFRWRGRRCTRISCLCSSRAASVLIYGIIRTTSSTLSTRCDTSISTKRSSLLHRKPHMAGTTIWSRSSIPY